MGVGQSLFQNYHLVAIFVLLLSFVQLNNSYASTASCNVVQGVNNGYSVGIQGTFDFGNNYTGNQTEGHFRGFRYQASTGTERIRCNTIGSHGVGLDLQGMATLGDQGSLTENSGNRFIGSYNGNLAADGVNGIMTSSQFFIRLNHLTAPNTVTGGFPGTWFRVPNANASDCVVLCDGDDPNDHQRSASNLDRQIAEGEFDKNTLMGYLLERNLYTALGENDALLNEDPSFEDFNAVYQGTDGAEFVDIRSAISEAYQLSLSQKARYEDALAQLQVIQAALADLDEAVQNGASITDQTVERDNLTSQMEQMQADILAIQAENLAARMQLSADLLDKNVAIQGQAMYIQNEKALNQIALSSVFIDQKVDVKDYATIRAIAAQCEWEAGPTVFIARDWYALLTNEVLESPCLISEERNGADESALSLDSSLDLAVHLSPNPARNTLNVALTGQKKDVSLRYSIFDMQGTRISSNDIPAGMSSLSIDISTYQNGVYFIELTSLSGEATRTKFIVSK